MGRGLALAFALAVVGAGPAWADGARCAGATRSGGDWPMPGHDLSNTRDQPAGGVLTPTKASELQPAWSFYIGEQSGPTAANLSDLNGTPIEANGCVYVGSGATAIDNVFALNADTGELVWHRHLDAGVGGLGGAIPGSLSYSDGLVYALVNKPGDGSSGPYVAALDAATGAVEWTSRPIVTTAGYYTNASPTVAGGVVVAGFSAPEGDPYGHGGFGLLDAATGKLLAVTYTVPPSAWGTPSNPGYAGGGVWTTPAADPKAGFAYIGTGNPFSKQTQYPTTDAILKVDIDPDRSTFGRIVGYYPGNIDQLSSLIKTLSGPTCELLPDDPLRTLPTTDKRLQELQGLVGNSIGCAQLDLDFGAAANLFRDHQGRLIVGDLQKSGFYHAVYAATMKRAWWSMIGASCQVCNGASTALDRGSIFGDVSPGSLMTSIAQDAGKLRWYSPVADAFHYEPVSTADGVVYTMDGTGFFDAFDARNGLPLLRRSLVNDAGTDALPPDGYNSSGAAIARGTVYLEAGSHVLAYRPPTAASIAGSPPRGPA